MIVRKTKDEILAEKESIDVDKVLAKELTNKMK